MSRTKRSGLTRRSMIAATAGSVGALGLAGSGAEALAQAASPTFFTPSELALVDELSEMIVPADDHSPGARAARVAAYVDARLAEAVDEGLRRHWRAGLAAIDAAARTAHGRVFLALAPAEREAVLTAIAAAERDPQTEAERFFVELKRWTVKAYYTSAIGLHQEMEYKGNTLLQEYVGTDVSR